MDDHLALLLLAVAAYPLMLPTAPVTAAALLTYALTASRSDTDEDAP